jgi:hypothetical protein
MILILSGSLLVGPPTLAVSGPFAEAQDQPNPTPRIVAKRPLPVAIHVGPDTRGGFIDANRGVLDSIKDIKKALRGKRLFRVVEDRAEATVVLIVQDRGAGDRDAGTVSVPIGNQRWYLPVRTIEIGTRLQVGEYQRPIVCVDDNWTGCARKIVRDVEAWVSANRERLAEIGRSSEPTTHDASRTCGAWVVAYFAENSTDEQKRFIDAAIDDLERLVTARLQGSTPSRSAPERSALANHLVSHCMARILEPIDTAARAVAALLIPQ